MILIKEIKFRTFTPLKIEKVREALKLLNDNSWEFVDLKFLGAEDKFLIIYTEPENISKEEPTKEQKPDLLPPIEDKTVPPPQDVKRFESNLEQIKTEEPTNNINNIFEKIKENRLIVIIGLAILIVIWIITKG